jgi:hypothetical protein
MQRTFLFSLLLFLFANYTWAQDSTCTEATEPNPTYKASYATGLMGMQQYLADIPAIKRTAGMTGSSGRSYVAFKICSDGTTSDVVVQRGIGSEVSEQLVKAFSTMKFWPAQLNYKNVATKAMVIVNIQQNQPIKCEIGGGIKPTVRKQAELIKGPNWQTEYNKIFKACLKSNTGFKGTFWYNVTVDEDGNPMYISLRKESREAGSRNTLMFGCFQWELKKFIKYTPASVDGINVSSTVRFGVTVQ